MFTILSDDVGRHDFLLTPCSIDTFRIIYDHQGDHPSCFGNLVANLAAFGIEPDQIPTTMNLFMNVMVADSGELTIGPPGLNRGMRSSFGPRRDLIVGLTACSAEMSNNYSFKPIDYQILAPEHDSLEGNPRVTIRALFLNCSLKPSSALLEHPGPDRQGRRAVHRLGVETECLRVVDSQGRLRRGDGRGGRRRLAVVLDRIRAADILVIASPIWIGERSRRSPRWSPSGSTRRPISSTTASSTRCTARSAAPSRSASRTAARASSRASSTT